MSITDPEEGKLSFWIYVTFAAVLCITCPIRIVIGEIRHRRRIERINQLQVELQEVVLHREAQELVGMEDFSEYMVEVDKENIEQKECIICYHDFKERDTVILRCGHFYHRGCINQWLNYKETCPICRKSCKF